MYTAPGLYPSGQRFQLAGMPMLYGARSGLAACADPWNIADASCLDASGGSGGGGFDWNALVQTVLNDVTQIIKPGAPAIRPVYTPTSTAAGQAFTAAGQAFSNPLLWLGLGLGAVLLLRKK